MVVTSTVALPEPDRWTAWASGLEIVQTPVSAPAAGRVGGAVVAVAARAQRRRVALGRPRAATGPLGAPPAVVGLNRDRRVADRRRRVLQELVVEAHDLVEPAGAAHLQAATDAFMHAEILTYSRSRGLFAGVSLEGSTLRQDNGANEKLYGHKVSAKEIVARGGGSQKVAGILQKASPKNESDPVSLK